MKVLIATLTNSKSENLNEMKLVNHLVSISHYGIGIGTSKYSGLPSTDHIIFELQIRLPIHILLNQYYC